MTAENITDAVVNCVLSVIPAVGNHAEDLPCSELDVAEIILKIEAHFGIDIPDETLLSSVSVNDLVSLVNAELGE